MLPIEIPGGELWDEKKHEFIYIPRQTLQLEHSLVSISQWESKWNKAFLSKREKTTEEVMDYIKCMTLTPNVQPEVYSFLTRENVDQIHNYISAPMTATVISQNKQGGGNRDTVTSELIYWWMITLNIPFECQYWHLNRLLTLVQVCNVKNSPPKKTGRRELASRYAAQNAARRKQLGSRG